MSSLNRKTVAAALVSALQAIDGTGVYLVDVSGPGQVTRLISAGMPTSHVYPRIEVWCGGARLENRNDGDLSSYGQTMEYWLVGFVQGAGSQQATEDAAADMEESIVRALHGNRSLNGTVHDLDASTDVVTSTDAESGAAVGVVVVRGNLYWIRA
jgi:hypothetical protein